MQTHLYVKNPFTSPAFQYFVLKKLLSPYTFYTFLHFLHFA